jgi:hypothetical protein
MRELTKDEKIAAYDFAATRIESSIDFWGHSMCLILWTWLKSHKEGCETWHDVFKVFPEWLLRKPCHVWGAAEYWFPHGRTGNLKRTVLLRECIDELLNEY